MAGGSLATWPATIRAQDRLFRLAILSHFEPIDPATGERERYWTVFFDEMRRLGYDERLNLAVAWYSTQKEIDRAAEIAAAVAAQKPDAIFTPDARMAVILKTTARGIPVVAIMIDPVGSSITSSLSHPDGNVTGFTIDPGVQLIAKRLELFRQAVPAASRMAWLRPRRTVNLPVSKATRDAVEAAGIELVEAILEAPIDAAAYHRAFAAMAATGVDSLWVASTGESLEHRKLIAELALAARLPSMVGWRDNVEAGGLMSYGNDVDHTMRGSAGYVVRILKGAAPAALPIQQPNKFELAINLKTAKALGLDLPQALLLQADVVIE